VERNVETDADEVERNVETDADEIAETADIADADPERGSVIPLRAARNRSDGAE